MEIVLAPLAGVTDLAFRLMARKYGIFGVPISFAHTEMVSAKALHYNDKKTLELLKTAENDRPLGVQIFGSEPEIMAEAAAKIALLGIADAIDINMGCPARKIVKNGDGGALMKNIPLAGEIIKAVVGAANGLPVTVKTRLGWDNSELTAIELAKIAEDAGVAGITVHGRTVLQEFRGEADWNKIREVADAISIPLTGNGDIKSEQQAKQCGIERVMVGRAAMEGNIKHAKEHLALIEEFKGERGIFEARGVLIRYLKGSAALRRRAAVAKTYDEMREIVNYAETVGDLGC